MIGKVSDKAHGNDFYNISPYWVAIVWTQLYKPLQRTYQMRKKACLFKTAPIGFKRTMTLQAITTFTSAA